MKRSPIKRKSPLVSKIRKPRPKKPSATTLKNKADKLAAAWCKRVGECRAQGYAGIKCSQRLEWAHVKSRGHLVIRHDPRNSVCLCNLHHRHFTVNPDEWVKWADSNDPGVWDYLNSILILRKEERPPKKMIDVYEEWIRWYKEKESSTKEDGD